MTIRLSCLLSICVLLALLGCSQPNPAGGGAAAPVGPAGADASAAATWNSQYTEPSDQECEAFAKQIEDALASNNAAAFRDLIDWDELLNRGSANIGLKPRDLVSFQAGFKQSLSGPFSLEAQMMNAVQQNGSYKFLRLRQKEDGKRALFRLLSAQGLNYHDLVFGKRADGSMRIIDFYVFLSGELLSETIRNAALGLVAESNRSFLSKLSGQQSEYVQSIPKIKTMGERLQTGAFQEVINIYHSLPQSVKQQKTVLLARYRAAQEVSLDEWTATIEDFRKYHANDACLNLLLIDHYTLQKDYNSALQTIDTLDQEVDDPYLDLLRANFHALNGNYTEAQRLQQEAQKAGVTVP